MTQTHNQRLFTITQTHNQRLFIMTQTHTLQIVEVIPFAKLQNDI